MNVFGFVTRVGKSIFSPGSDSREAKETEPEESPSNQQQEEEEKEGEKEGEKEEEVVVENSNPPVPSEEASSAHMRGPDPIAGTGMPLNSQQLLNSNTITKSNTNTNTNKHNNAPVVDLLSTDDEVIGGDEGGFSDGKNDIGPALRMNNLSLDAKLKSMRKSSAEVSAEIADGTSLKPTAMATASPSPSTKSSPSLATSETSNVYDDEEDGEEEGKENATTTPTVHTASATIISKLSRDPIEPSTAKFVSAAGPKPPPLSAIKPPPPALPAPQPATTTTATATTTTTTTTTSGADMVLVGTKIRKRKSNSSHSSDSVIELSSDAASSDSKWGEDNPHQKKRKTTVAPPPHEPSKPQPSGQDVSRSLSFSSSLKETAISENKSEISNIGKQPEHGQGQGHGLVRDDSLEKSSSKTTSTNDSESVATSDGKRQQSDDDDPTDSEMESEDDSDESEEDLVPMNDVEKPFAAAGASSSPHKDTKSVPSDKVHHHHQPVEQRKKEVCESPEAAVESLDRAIPQFRLPPELVPYNKPGVCDYGVIRTSRLRNRSKKTNTPEDVLYQNIQGQRRCKATKDGGIFDGTTRNATRCLNCAEGVFKFCHTHRELDLDQRLYWEKRRAQSSSTVRSNQTTKTGTTAIRKKARTKLSQKGTTGSQRKGLQANDTYTMNDVRQCVFLMTMKYGGGQRKRCSRHSLMSEPYCACHVRFAPPMRKDEFFRGHPGTMRCTAVSKAGTLCRYKALDQSVFCCKHSNVPTEKVSPIEIVADANVKMEDKNKVDPSDNAQLTEGSARRSTGKTGKKKDAVAVAKNGADDSTMNMNSSDGLEFATKQSKRSKYASTHSRSSLALSDQVPKNIEFTRQIEIPKAKLELASSFEERCNFIYKFKRCTYKSVEGDILCFKCRQCVEEKEPFDHIVTDDSAKTNEKTLSSNKCINVNLGIQCEKMACGGEILCNDCLRSFGGKKESMFEIPNNSDEDSGAEEKSDKMDTSCSSSHSDNDNDTDTSFSDSDDSEDSHGSGGTDYDAYCTAYTHQEFFNMWKNFEKKTERMDEVEDSRLIKRANKTMDPMDTDGQVKAQYGRVLPHAMKKMIKILELGRDDVFLDIGHGVGNTCLHASFCIGCDSRGIEVVSDRHEIAEKFRGGMYAEHNGRLEARPKIGNVDLRLGRLEDPDQKNFLTNGVTRAYVNNFNGVFAERSSKNNDKWFLDDYISGIFASMAPGAIMVTFHPLNLGLDRDMANELRNRHDLEESEYASYYHNERILLGKAWNSVKWNKRSGNTNEIYVYKYTRLHQPNHYDAVFLCSNPTCKLAIDMIPIPATTVNEDGRCVINHCKCKYSPKNLRKRNSKSLAEA